MDRGGRFPGGRSGCDAVGHGRGKWAWIAATAIASLIAGVFAFAYFTRKTPDAAAARFSFAPPFKADAVDVAVSPDGRRIAFADADGGSALWLRSVDSFTAEKLPGTDGAVRPFWSPDGRSLGFFSNGLKRVDFSGGQSSVQTITSLAIRLTGAPGARRASSCTRRRVPAPDSIASRPAVERQPRQPG